MQKSIQTNIVSQDMSGDIYLSLIYKLGSSTEVDWNVGQFFIVAKFQGKGVGSHVAKQLFDRFPGIWETRQIPENIGAVQFWEKVVTQYTHGHFEKSIKLIRKEGVYYPRVYLKFSSQSKDSSF